MWRLIPAHAGKTAPVTWILRPRWAHPRSRGENTPEEREYFAASGSSPLTRGKRLGGLVHGVDSGLIPAHAGKTSPTPHPAHALAAHPRSRGENVPSVNHPVNRWGSSPLTRGKRAHAVGRGCRVGLIPAHAGKTWWTPTGWEPSRAHPRSRGENMVANFEAPA